MTYRHTIPTANYTNFTEVFNQFINLAKWFWLSNYHNFSPW